MTEDEICKRCRCDGEHFWRCARYGTNPPGCEHFISLEGTYGECPKCGRYSFGDNSCVCGYVEGADE